MGDQHTSPVDQGRDEHRSPVLRAVRAMPGWKRKLLALSLVIGLVGACGQAISFIRHHWGNAPVTATPAVAPAASSAQQMPAGSSGLVSAQPVAPATGQPDVTSPASTHSTLTDTISPWMRRIGLSLFVGIVIGILFRTFMKVAAGLTLLAGGALLALAHFHIVDTTSLDAQYHSTFAWVSAQAYQLKDVVFHALPSSTAAAVGFFTGFKKH